MKLRDDEIAIEHELRHGPCHQAVVKVKETKRSLIFFDDDLKKHPDYHSTEHKLKFEKKCSAEQGDRLSIVCEFYTFTYKKCELGHLHQDVKSKWQYEAFSLQWEHVENLISWLEQGSWKKIRVKQ